MHFTNLNLYKASDRLLTFENYNSLYSTEFVLLGFYLYKIADFYSSTTLKCAFCYITFSETHPIHIDNKHKEFSPHCPTLKKNSTVNICKICYDNTQTCVFLPCHHVVSCVKCARVLDKCPICRGKITEHIELLFC